MSKTTDARARLHAAIAARIRTAAVHIADTASHPNHDLASRGYPGGARKVLVMALPRQLVTGIPQATWQALHREGLVTLTRVDMLCILPRWHRDPLATAALATESAQATGSEWFTAVEV